jgi:Rod binding domain-containing protein
MIKSMRSTVGKPAYFHGGRGEEVFRSQLDQTLAQHMTEATADRFADPMFHRQFPKLSVGQSA